MLWPVSYHHQSSQVPAVPDLMIPLTTSSRFRLKTTLHQEMGLLVWRFVGPPTHQSAPYTVVRALVDGPSKTYRRRSPMVHRAHGNHESCLGRISNIVKLRARYSIRTCYKLATTLYNQAVEETLAPVSPSRLPLSITGNTHRTFSGQQYEDLHPAQDFCRG